MLKYVGTQIVFQEVPDEVSLAINLSLCPNHCKGCHSPELWEDIGEELTLKTLEKLIGQNPGITCVAFMGGDNDVWGLYEAAKTAGGDGWTEDRFYLTAEGGLVLLKGSDESSQNMYYWTTEGEQPAWKDTYQGIFQKK